MDPVSREMGCEGPSPTLGEGNSSIFWCDNQGPVVLVWDGNLGKWKKSKWTKTIRRRGVDGDQQMVDQKRRPDTPVNWDMIVSGKWIQKATWNRWGMGDYEGTGATP